MGRHSDERDTASNGPEPVAALSEPRGGYTDTPETPGDDLSLFDPDDCGLWDLRPCLRRWEWYGDDTRPPRAVVNVELPEDPT